MKTKRKFLALTLALILVLALTACGASKSTGTDETAAGGGGGTAAYDTESAEEPMATANTSIANYSDNAYASETDIDSDSTDELPASEKIIYSGSAEIETMDFDKTIEDLNKMISDAGGFVENSSVTGSDFYTEYNGGRTYRSAQYTFRVPVSKFKTLMDGLGSLGNVPYSSTNAENITMSYTDTESRLEAARTKQERLLELMKQATDMEDIITIENALSDVEYQIENLTSQIKNWDSLINYSTLSITVSEVSLYTDENTNTLSYGEQLKTAFTRSLKGLGRFFKGFFKFLVGAFPVLVVLAVIAVPVTLIVKSARKKKKAKTPPMRQAPLMPPAQNTNGEDNGEQDKK